MQTLSLTGPSGIGKGYVKGYLKQRFGFYEPPFYTTRTRRDCERKNCDDRIFVNREDFLERQARRDLVFCREIHGDLYGLSLSDLEKSSSGHGRILELYVDNVESFRENFPEAVMIALIPDDLEMLGKRLKSRKESPETIERRINSAIYETNRIRNLNEKFNLVYEVHSEKENLVLSDIEGYIQLFWSGKTC